VSVFFCIPYFKPCLCASLLQAVGHLLAATVLILTCHQRRPFLRSNLGWNILNIIDWYVAFFGHLLITVIEHSPTASSSDHIPLFLSHCNSLCTFSLSWLICVVLAWEVSGEERSLCQTWMYRDYCFISVMWSNLDNDLLSWILVTLLLVGQGIRKP
jgi:hypothetical protein